MRSTTTYFAKGGRIYAKTPEGVREVTTALGTGGQDLERFEEALNVAREQRMRAFRVAQARALNMTREERKRTT